jgi:hypothetical protein
MGIALFPYDITVEPESKILYLNKMSSEASAAGDSVLFLVFDYGNFETAAIAVR